MALILVNCFRVFFFRTEGKKIVNRKFEAIRAIWPVLRRADFVLTKDPRPLYYKTPPCAFYHKISLRKAFWVLSKDEIRPA